MDAINVTVEDVADFGAAPRSADWILGDWTYVDGTRSKNPAKILLELLAPETELGDGHLQLYRKYLASCVNFNTSQYTVSAVPDALLLQFYRAELCAFPGAELGLQASVYLDGETGFRQFDRSTRHSKSVVVGVKSRIWLR